MELATVPGQAGNDSSWGHDLELAGSFMGGAWRGAFGDFSVTLAVSNVDGEIAAATGLFRGLDNAISSVGASSQFVEKLVISDAVALAQVANTLAVRLYEENAMIWKECAGLLGTAVIVGMYGAWGRPASLAPVRRTRNQKFLCVGEDLESRRETISLT
jgi:hypothetical protein